MSAIDNKHVIEIFSINVQSGKSRKTGNDYAIHKAQCLIKGPDGAQQIGELNITEEIANKTPPGKYLAEFELGVNYERLVVPRVVALHPLAEPGSRNTTARSATSAPPASAPGQ